MLVLVKHKRFRIQRNIVMLLLDVTEGVFNFNLKKKGAFNDRFSCCVYHQNLLLMF